MEKRWYIVHAYSNFERKVAEAIKDRAKAAVDPFMQAVVANFGKVAKKGNLHLHPLINRLVDAELLEKMGAKKKEMPAAE